MSYPPQYPFGLSLEEIYTAANEAYRNNEIEKAAEGYLYLVQRGVENGYLYYNLGNTYFRLGDLGNSILWYERALRYLPRYQDLRINYQYAHSQLTDEEFRQPDYGGTVGFFMNLHNMFNLRENLLITLIFFWLWALCLVTLLCIPNEVWKTRIRIPCWILGIVLIIFFLSTGYKSYQYEYTSAAIVMDSAVDVKTAPSPEFSTSFTLHVGTKVIVEQEQQDWVRITLPGNPGFTGWMPKKAIQVI